MRAPRYDVPDAVVRQLKRRRWTRRGIFATLLALALSAALDRSGFFHYRGDDWGNFDKKHALVTEVVDGDTVHIRVSPLAKDEKVRLLGIDAPEVAHARGETPAHFGPEAKKRLSELVNGKTVVVRLDTTETRDKYHRLLAYLYLGDADNVNLSLVQGGYAYAHRIYPHSLRRQFEQAEDEARAKGRGLWTDVTEAQMPGWRQHWLAQRRDHATAAR